VIFAQNEQMSTMLKVFSRRRPWNRTPKRMVYYRI